MGRSALSDLDPALGIIDFSSVATGIEAGDAMVKASPVGSLYAGSVHPGRYLVLVSGDTASVEIAMDVGRHIGEDDVLGWVFLPDVHRTVATAIAAGRTGADIEEEALGIIETDTVSAVIRAADAGVKAAAVTLSAIEMADGLGGKGYVLFSGPVAEVEAAVEAGADRASGDAALVRDVVVAQLHAEMRHNLVSELTFAGRVMLRPQERKA